MDKEDIEIAVKSEAESYVKKNIYDFTEDVEEFGQETRKHLKNPKSIKEIWEFKKALGKGETSGLSRLTQVSKKLQRNKVNAKFRKAKIDVVDINSNKSSISVKTDISIRTPTPGPSLSSPEHDKIKHDREKGKSNLTV